MSETKAALGIDFLLRIETSFGHVFYVKAITLSSRESKDDPPRHLISVEAEVLRGMSEDSWKRVRSLCDNAESRDGFCGLSEDASTLRDAVRSFVEAPRKPLAQ